MATEDHEITCPECGTRLIVSVPRPEYRDNIDIKVVEVECLKRRHRWTYKGNLKRRIVCPSCGSTKSEANRQIFGKWSVSQLPGR